MKQIKLKKLFEFILVEDDSKIIGDHSLEGMKVLSVLKDYWY